MEGRGSETLENSEMTNKDLFLFLLLIFLVAGCGFHSDLVKKQNDFGVKSAKMGLWNEAIMRWERVLEIDPNNAQAHNNLGVAYESMRKFEAAQAEYKTAIELDPENKIYTSNYNRFKQNHERASKRDKPQNSELDTEDSEHGTEDSVPDSST